MRRRRQSAWSHGGSLGCSLAGGLLLLVLAAGCSEPPPEPEPVVRPVKILEVGPGATGDVREYPGNVRAVQHAEMGFEVAGRVVEFPVEEGRAVEKGAELARLDPRDYQDKVAAAQALRDNAYVDYERAETLFKEGVTAQAERDRKRAWYEVQEADLNTAKKGLEDTVLRAPFAGVVASKLVRDFRNVQAKEPILILQDDSSYEIEIYVPERDVTTRPEGGRSNEEMTARTRPEVALTSHPDRRFPARVREVATTADPSTRTFKVTLAFERPDDVRVLPGMTAKVIVHPQGIGGGAAPIRIPAGAAVADDAGDPYVWLVAPDAMTVSRRAVELGALGGSEVVVSKGLEAGEWIAVSGVHQLRDGMQVSRYEP
jgi:RND family efflux transporter MFP subunit